jgi:hypothetical protein
VDLDDGPEADADLTFFLCEYWQISVGGDLSGGIMVEAKFDGKSNEGTNEAPESSTLTLGG